MKLLALTAAAFLVLLAPAKARAADADEPYRVIPIGGDEIIDLDFEPEHPNMESAILKTQRGPHANQLRVVGLGLGKASFMVHNRAGVIFKKVKFHVIKIESYQHFENVKRLLKNAKNVRVGYEGDNIVVDGDEVSDADKTRIEKLEKVYPEILNLVAE